MLILFVIAGNAGSSAPVLRGIAHSAFEAEQSRDPPASLNMPKALAGRCALVTGSTGAIGYAIAEALAEAGADVCLTGFGEPDAIERQRVALAQTYGVKAIYRASELDTAEGCHTLVKGVIAHFGRCDILVVRVTAFEPRVERGWLRYVAELVEP